MEGSTMKRWLLVQDYPQISKLNQGQKIFILCNSFVNRIIIDSNIIMM